MGALVTVLALLVAVTAVAWPLLRATTARADARDRDRIEDLLAARESLYRRIRELELDKRTGKLDPAEFREQDRRLRAEAIEVLRELDALGVGAGGPSESVAKAVPVGEPEPEPVGTATLRQP